LSKRKNFDYLTNEHEIIGDFDNMLKGIGVSPGIAIGRPLFRGRSQVEITAKEADDPEHERSRLEKAVSRCYGQYENLIQTLSEDAVDEINLLKAYQMLLYDPALRTEIDKGIASGFRAEYSVQKAADKLAGVLANMQDPLFAARQDDVRDVEARLVESLICQPEEMISMTDNPYILITRELTTSELIELRKKNLAGIIAERGGATAHASVLARSFEVPFVVLPSAIHVFQNVGILFIDGETGQVSAVDNEEDMQAALVKKDEYYKLQQLYKTMEGKLAKDADGDRIVLSCNIGSLSEIDDIAIKESDGVGLMRTEFLFSSRKEPPTEEEQYAVYKEAVQRLGNKGLVIRTLDAGADKLIDYLEFEAEDNPFLGRRAIRISLENTEMFLDQLRAILRASVHGNIKLMFPLIGTLEELNAAKSLLDQARTELAARDLPFDTDMEVGMMVEVPSAAILSDVFAAEVDFFSVGTNDLIQYVMAADRGNPNVASLYTPYQPSVVRLLRYVVDCAHSAGIRVCLCGEIGQDPHLLSVLLGLGFDEISVSPAGLLRTKYYLSKLQKNKARQCAESILHMRSATHVQMTLEAFLNDLKG
jgi:phosphotransferase system enzyme I (PtsI)